MAVATAKRKSAEPMSDEDLTHLRMALGRLGRVLRQQTDEDLSYALTSLLFTIGRMEPATASDLAEAEKVTPPSVSRSLKRLEALNLIERAADPVDGRVTRVRLTKAGRKERAYILKARDVWLIEHLRQLDAAEIGMIMQALPALARLCDPELPIAPR
jgi:DNA-binding MarR family transcriptional regulator